MLAVMRPKKSRSEKRIERVPVRDARTSDLLTDLGLYNKRQYMPAGYYSRPSLGRQEIVMYQGAGEDVLKHEQTHASQTSRLAKILGLPSRAQDVEVRSAGNSLRSSLTEDQYANMNKAGQYFSTQPHELEATVMSIRPGLEQAGISLDQDFEGLRSSLEAENKRGNLNTNMTNLLAMMNNQWTPEQQNLIMRAINYNR